MASVLFELVLEHEGLWWLKWTREQESRIEDAIVYPSLGQLGPCI